MIKHCEYSSKRWTERYIWRNIEAQSLKEEKIWCNGWCKDRNSLTGLLEFQDDNEPEQHAPKPFKYSCYTKILLLRLLISYEQHIIWF